jgi:hypothetical protein
MTDFPLMKAASWYPYYCLATSGLAATGQRDKERYYWRHRELTVCLLIDPTGITLDKF